MTPFDVDLRMSLIFFDPITEPFFFDVLAQKFAGGEPSAALSQFVADAGFSPHAIGDGVIAVPVMNPLSEGQEIIQSVVAAGCGLAIPFRNIVVWRGEEPLNATVDTLMWHPDMPISIGLVPEILRHAQHTRVGFVDRPVVITDLADPTGMTYAQAVFSRDFGIWLVEYQAGSVDKHYRLALPPEDNDDDATLKAAALIQYWLQYGTAVADYALWEKDDCSPDEQFCEYHHMPKVRIDIESKRFLL
ncbi:hypothetical protein CMUST_03090 [Corynebacterium mustelae]|uniref:Uncharacterized protein n=2 Tax=Corynebacterium mustelae TaxID=571915 RepID=A0A0G3H1H2_9CORY|nr:hypothetical protein CMUST_03090 [Corynebacterium mustelae]